MNHQPEIMRYLQSVQQATIDEISANVSFGYFHNGNKHLGDVLSRMVKSGKIERVKNGVFRISTKIQKNDPNQTDIFTPAGS